jgi:sulfate transport system ATP-binding protein
MPSRGLAASTDGRNLVDIRIEGVGKQFEGFAALSPIDLAIPSGQLVALLGPSGSGKTTLLRLIAGLVPVDGGRILFGGRDTTRLTLRERRVGFVFQHYALFPTMTVFENVAFGLRSRPRKTRPSDADIRTKVEALLRLVQMDEMRDRLPAQLSGGQRQRVALARAMAIDPTVLLLDEPFGALDAKVRIELRRWLRTIHDETGLTTVFVTHDQEEALELADRVVVMNKGRIEQDGTPDEVYSRPASPFVFDFIGRSNQLTGYVEGGRFHADGTAYAISATGMADGPATLFARPHDVGIGAPGEGYTGTITAIRVLAGRCSVEVALPAQSRPVEVDFVNGNSRNHPAAGETVDVVPHRWGLFSTG